MTETMDPASLRAELMRRRLSGVTAPRPAAGPRPADRSAPIPLSYAQQRLWLLDQLQPGTTEYLASTVLRLTGPLDEPALRRALDTLVARHEVLRTRYPLRDGDPVQVIDDPAPVDLTRLDLRALDRARAEARLAALGTTDRQPVDLADGPVLRATLARLGPHEHALALTIHHIATDGWSDGLLVDELIRLYAGHRFPGPPALQYADVALWQRTGAPLDEHLAFWRDRLAGLVPVELPADRPRPPVRDPAGAFLPFVIPAPVARKLSELARRRGATTFQAALAGYLILLSRYTGLDDIAVGTTVAGRDHPQVQDLPGLFVNTVVLRADLSGSPSYSDVLDRVRDVTLDAHAHQDLPFERLVEELAPGRDPSRTPLFSTMFLMDDTPATVREAGGLRFERIPVGESSAKFDLTVAIAERPDGSLAGGITYATALFDRATVERLAGHLGQLLAGAVADPRSPADRLDLLTAGELRQLTRGGNGSVQTYPGGTLPALLEAQAAGTPTATALRYEGREWTYAEVNARANRIAHHLRGLGAGPESVVAVELPRGADLVFALLGVLKAGAAYLPLDPEHPADRRAFMAQDAGARIVVTERLLADAEGGDDSDPVSGVTPAHAAYVIYTSGSTGRPKGVLIEHRAIVNRLQWMQQTYRLDAGDRVLQKTPAGFDVSVWEFFWPLLTGATLVVARPGGHRDPAYLAALIAAERITTLHFVPSMLRAFLAEPCGTLPSVRRIICSGEALPADLADAVHERIGGELHNLYGPTETAVDVTALRCLPGEPVTIGRPIANTSAYIVDDRGRPQPVGVPGELLIGGVQVARGYIGRPGLTADRFVPDPFGADPGGRLYRTGDLARHRPDGTIEYLGRLDHQVKIAGQRIELGEVETVLRECPGVTDAAAAVADGQLVGYVVTDTSVDDIRAHLRRRLPEAMIPARWAVLAALPLTGSGKLDRRALPDPDAPVPTGAYDAPHGEVENLLAGEFGAALGIAKVGRHDSFFQLGGDSMRAIRVVGAARAAGIALRVQDMFTHQSVAALAELTGSRAESSPERPVEPFTQISDADRRLLPPGLSDAYPITQNQAGMLYEMLSGADRAVYRNVSCYRIRDGKPFAAGALEQALRLLLVRHEILRTSFDLGTYSEIMQLVHERAELPVEVRDLRGRPAADQQDAVRSFLAAEREVPFDIGRAPLVRYTVHLLSDQEWLLTHAECHAILDGWSHTATVAMLIDLYRGVRDGTPPELPAPPGVRFADFVHLERAALDSTEDREFWAATVASRDRFELPPEWATEPAGAPATIVDVPWADLAPGLKRLAAAANASLKSVLHAAHLKALSVATGQERFFDGLLCNGRPERLRGDEVFGMYLNTVPFAADTRARTWRELVAGVFAEEARLWPHRRYPQPTMQRDWGSASRLIEVAFGYLDFHVLAGEAESGVRMIDDFSPGSLALEVWTFPGVLRLGADPARIGRPHLELLRRTYRHVLEAMAADPGGDARAVGLAAADRHDAVDRFQNPVAFPALPLLHDLVPTGAAVALRQGDRTLSYDEVHALAGGLAARLHRLGVGPDTVVGLLLPRGTDLVVAMLAVLRAGGAFLPLDPAYPAERIRYMLDDAAPAVVLTDPAYAALAPGAEIVDHEAYRTLPAAPPPALNGENLAYVIYTSGSTGRPKGVGVPHRALLNLRHAQNRHLDVRPGDRVLQFASPSFDASVWELAMALTNGAALVLPPPGTDPGDLRAQAGVVTHMTVPPSLLDRLRPDDFPHLRVLVTAGEAVTAEQVARWAPHTRVVNGYGPTETAVCAAAAELGTSAPAGPPPIGQPFANARVYVLDHDQRPLPAGVRGELVVGGAGVSRGYLGRPALTAERFVPDPYATVPGQRMYRTGDVASRSAEGTLSFHGRRDHQVKVRGFRIELGEVEHALAACPGVTGAVCTVHRPGTPDATLVAYTRGGVPAADLRAHLADRLPQHLIPTHFRAVDDFPLTPAGKVDRAALPAPDGSRPATGAAYTAPRTDRERHLAQAWSEALGVARIGADDDFFDLGGHSLAMMRVIAALRSRHGYELTFRSFLEQRTVARLAATLTEQSSGRALMWLRDGTGRVPLICVHPGGGSAHWYQRLLPHLHPEQPVAAFEWPGPHPQGTPSTEQMAARYLAELRDARLEGPYRILSWCGGSGIAMEMAHRLIDAGEQVTVMLLDPGLDMHSRDDGWSELALMRRLEALLAEGADTPQRRTEILSLLDHLVDDVDPATGIVLPEGGAGHWPAAVRIWREVMEMDMSYRHRVFPGRLELIASDELVRGEHEVASGQSYGDYLARWRELVTGGVRVHRVPGDHFSVLREPHVRRFAELITGLLDDA
ncbi:thioester reductase [Actinoplanes sp. SE50]|uniref:non-ribosomal peptide synthetase n=1 Tax=unclassified Actinoplanes TaxID=2626549 RepID=UPI00023ED60E|nr:MULTISPECIES: non-ribosomal peptide synthetase [unclassified Actinoplanes]AEV85018.1 peptide synthase [Actinoplanes sp. SE50/110]ATO83409.1 thioester reductase [Actinoplanes sp. SE50]SLM00816.1 non-ribosomal peptide synthetase [Actinoplanes sp. SE50/110]